VEGPYLAAAVFSRPLEGGLSVRNLPTKLRWLSVRAWLKVDSRTPRP
jgi:hypothetical protein